MGNIRKLKIEEIDKISEDLDKGNSKQRKSSVRKIGKFLINELSEQLLNSYIALKKTAKNREIQSEMIKSLGLIKEVGLLPYLEKIIEENLEEDLITFEAAKAFIRIKSKDKQETKENIFKLLDIGGKSIKDGAVAVLAHEKLQLEEREMLLLVDIVDNDEVFDDDLDYREYLISAMSTWPKKIALPFFEKYTGDTRINQEVIKEARKGKSTYSDWQGNGPNSKASGHIHTGRHTNDYIDRVNRDIINADNIGGEKVVEKQLEIIREGLLDKGYTQLQTEIDAKRIKLKRKDLNKTVKCSG